MNEPQDAIDSVLKALAAVEPAAGFEARMHHALQQGAASQRMGRVPFALMTSVALLLCAIAIGVAVHVRRSSPAVAIVKPLPPSSPSLVAVTREVTMHQPTAKAHPVTLVRADLPLHADADAVRPHENIPPPPLPLTQEERLVIRMMHRDDSTQLAQLSPDARARGLHDDAESYRAFFAPGPPLQGQPIYIQPIFDQHISGGSQ